MQLPDRDENVRYLTIPQMMRETNLGRDLVNRLAEEADAVIRIGRAVRINADKFYKYVEFEYKG